MNSMAFPYQLDTIEIACVQNLTFVVIVKELVRCFKCKHAFVEKTTELNLKGILCHFLWTTGFPLWALWVK